ncbi:vWA domain-containing protein [Desertimonas flava]|uniref:vWA domain-containing protein n=1 Tax=Desertimonas flava TaxID=2064846 RepID=UPI00196998E7|nr:VWA domain-containing protein [Desertimonas flava]
MSRAELARNASFEQLSPEVGTLDEEALAELLDEDADEALAMLASMTGAMDRELRAAARRLAGRLMLEVARRGPVRSRRVGRIVTTRWRPDAGDLDVDASLDAIVAAKARRDAVEADDLRVRDWSRPDTALCLLLDRSGSMGGRPLATNAVAAAAVAWRNPDDYSVVSFARQAIVVKPQATPAGSVETVVDSVLALRGHGTTDLANALGAAGRQLRRSRAGRKVTVLLSDCRSNEPGDTHAAAAALDELVVVAPAADADEATAFASAVGARLSTIDGPSDVPAALAALLM